MRIGWGSRLLSRAVAAVVLRGIYRRLLFRCRTAILAFLGKRGTFTYLPSSSLLSSGSFEAVAYRPVEEVRFRPPLVIRDDDGLPHRPFVGNYRVPAPWYAVFANAYLLGQWAAGLSSNGEIIAETITPEANHIKLGVVPVTHLKRAMSALARGASASQRAHDDTICSMVGVWSKAYYHWLIDYLPRLEAVEAYASQSGSHATLIIDSHATRWQTESLALLGFRQDRTIAWNGGPEQMSRLLVPSFPERFVEPDRKSSAVSPAALEWLSTRLRSELHADNGNAHRRLYLSRGSAPGRRVVNEEELVARLVDHGFEAVQPDELSFSEQVHLFASAEAVVGPHGAALTSVIFGDQIKVVELYGSYWNRGIYVVSSAKGFVYGTLRCEPRFTLHPHRHDMFVPLDDLSRLIGRMDL